MKISVVIPTYNRANTILRALKSVLNQSYKADEIIVIDDGSSDETQEILKKFQDQIVLISQDNLGVSSARNRGIELCKNEWVAFLDSDDFWHKDKLKLQVEFHTKNRDILFSHTNELWIRDDKVINQKSHHKKPQGECFLENLNFCKIAPSSVMINKKILKDVGYFDQSLKVCEDYDLWLRVLYKYSVGLLHERLVTKYDGEKNQLSYRYFAMDKFRIYALEKHLNSRYHVEIKTEIIKKLNILLNGSKKHKNQEIYEYCIKKLQELK